MTDQLKPCTCGSSDVGGNTLRTSGYLIHCYVCGNAQVGKNGDDAVEKWNKRVTKEATK